MPRLKMLAPADLNEQQRKVYDGVVAGPRGHAPAPLFAWLESPEFADRAQRLGAFVRYQTTLPPRLSELAILVVARHWSSQYEWSVHKREALKGGVDAAVIADIAARRRPSFANTDECALYDFCVSLQENHVVPDAVYRAAVDALGQRGVVELIGILGYYTLISMTLNTFEIEVPGQAQVRGDFAGL